MFGRFNLRAQAGNDRWLLHLLNYATQPVQQIKITLAAPATKSPSSPLTKSPSANIRFFGSEARTEFTVPTVEIYSLVLIQPAG
jgi:hypothetical protein